MKYFFDTEFIEGFKKPIKWLPTIGNFNKPYHSIQLISIGIVCEDGREYYAVSNEYNYNDASDWVKENVIKQLGDSYPIGKSNKQIANEISEFCMVAEFKEYEGSRVYQENGYTAKGRLEWINPVFYAYYADYDWVVFCSLFGTMIDLPKGFPMYCRDLKQTLDEKCEYNDAFYSLKIRDWHELGENDKLDAIKKHPNYPKQADEHNALDDAKWNYKLYKFLQTI